MLIRKPVDDDERVVAMVTKLVEQFHPRLGEFHAFTNSIVIHADCFAWMREAPSDGIHAIVTDPPYGVKEYDPEQLEKRAKGSGGV